MATALTGSGPASAAVVSLIIMHACLQNNLRNNIRISNSWLCIVMSDTAVAEAGPLPVRAVVTGLGSIAVAVETL